MSQREPRESRRGKGGARPPAGPSAAPLRLWGGGFNAPIDPLLDRFLRSFSFDQRLLRADVASNRAWVRALRGARLLEADGAERLDEALRSILDGRSGNGTGPGIPATARDAVAAGDAASPGGGDGVPEDVHTFVEERVRARVGADLAGRLRTGRSRNDLVATDLRILCREELASLRAAVAVAVGSFADLAQRAGDLAIPGYTHLRRAQPILLAHQLLAHAHRLIRDADRCDSARRRIDTCPMGSGALAGTTAAIDRQALARDLGFDRPSANSLDAVSDRDFVADTLYVCSLLMVHLSQIAEDLILATAEEFGWLALDDAGATGSSLMPQKKNPDVLELIRGKSGRVAGRLSGFLMTLKGLPAAYNRDLQEDKEPLFDALDTTGAALRALAVLLPLLRPVRERGLRVEGGDLLATDLADYLVGRGLPFAEAHRLAGEAAGRARRDGVSLRGLPLEAYRSIASAFGPDVAAWLTVDASLQRRDRVGGTAPERVAEDLRRVRAWAIAMQSAGAAAFGAAATDSTLRPATEDDLPEIETRIRFWSERGVMLPLAGRALRAALPDFRVLAPSAGASRPGLLAFGALRRYSALLGEIRSLVVAPGQEGRGLGRRLVEHLAAEAVAAGMKRVFVLTRTPDFFERLDFKRQPLESLPQKVFVDCTLCHRKDRCDEQALVRELS